MENEINQLKLRRASWAQQKADTRRDIGQQLQPRVELLRQSIREIGRAQYAPELEPEESEEPESEEPEESEDAEAPEDDEAAEESDVAESYGNGINQPQRGQPRIASFNRYIGG